MNKYKNKTTGKYKSKLEETCANLLEENKIDFEYEPLEVVLIDPFVYDLPSYERSGKEFKLQSSKVRKMSYKPDFVGLDWIIETKGKKTPDFQIKWKMFKQYLLQHDYKGLLFMPTNKSEIKKTIDILKQKKNESSVFQQRPSKQRSKSSNNSVKSNS